ncbi:hypothetical protein CWI75_16460 [Kineobactrum sediminis]|uniref:Uncharacterized protein n=1 Tax=Kineobactrum sediminis TaxID=1905677 RepID=A0A2N5XYL4_9GAMM|nr:hypothetical protein [Kineobactrum sediminis]PLW81226.1 hypothetical protein CWI75_16460 [Kineobactrum sediminis]
MKNHINQGLIAVTALGISQLSMAGSVPLGGPVLGVGLPAGIGGLAAIGGVAVIIGAQLIKRKNLKK